MKFLNLVLDKLLSPYAFFHGSEALCQLSPKDNELILPIHMAERSAVELVTNMPPVRHEFIH